MLYPSRNLKRERVSERMKIKIISKFLLEFGDTSSLVEGTEIKNGKGVSPEYLVALNACINHRGKNKHRKCEVGEGKGV